MKDRYEMYQKIKELAHKIEKLNVEPCLYIYSIKGRILYIDNITGKFISKEKALEKLAEQLDHILKCESGEGGAGLF